MPAPSEQIQNQMLDGGADTSPGHLVRRDEVRLCRRGFCLYSHAPAPKKVDTVVVGDAE